MLCFLYELVLPFKIEPWKPLYIIYKSFSSFCLIKLFESYKSFYVSLARQIFCQAWNDLNRLTCSQLSGMMFNHRDSKKLIRHN